MTGLSQAQIDAYRDDGFVKPIDVLSGEQVDGLRAEIDAIEGQFEGKLPLPVMRYFRVNGHVVIPMMARTAKAEAVLDAVSGLLGPDLLVWSCELFIKEAQSTSIVSWHQDLTYWGFGSTDCQITAWIALSNVNEQAGCMRFVPKSHHQEIVPHNDTFAANNLLSRGQEIAVEVDEKDAVLDELKPGQMSLHHGRMFHASGPNLTDERRIGMAIRYVTPEVRQTVSDCDYAMLARGVDRLGNWINLAEPGETFGESELALYQQILTNRNKALGQGAERPVRIYSE